MNFCLPLKPAIYQQDHCFVKERYATYSIGNLFYLTVHKETFASLNLGITSAGWQ